MLRTAKFMRVANIIRTESTLEADSLPQLLQRLQYATQVVPSQTASPPAAQMPQAEPQSQSPVQQSETSAANFGEIKINNSSIPTPHWIGPARIPVDLRDAIHEVKAGKRRKFDETVEVGFQLGIDPKRGDQGVRGSIVLPHGTGKPVRVCAFAEGTDADIATAAGADLVGGDAIISRVAAGEIDFDKCIATTGLMAKLRTVARILGPRGLMPSPKLGTLVDGAAITKAIGDMKGGRVEYRADMTRNLNAGIGKRSFTVDQLYQNFGTFAGAIMEARPAKLKGSNAKEYMLKITLSSTQGQGIPVTLQSVLLAISQSKMSLR